MLLFKAEHEEGESSESPNFQVLTPSSSGSTVLNHYLRSLHGGRDRNIVIPCRTVCVTSKLVDCDTKTCFTYVCVCVGFFDVITSLASVC
jgi:hypothetical protein